MKAAPLITFALSAGLLAAVQTTTPLPMLLAEHLLPGAGWLELLGLATLGAFITRGLMDPARVVRWRLWIWGLFSLVFFAQLALGLLGLEVCQMRPGKLHFPIPALIVAGPIYRGEGFFMPVLFGVTLLLVGPAWCSHLCYFGALDGLAAGRRRRPAPLPPWHQRARLGLLAAVVAAALALRLLGAPSLLAGSLALGLGLAGVAVMLLWSRRHGVMVHCTIYCPVGLLAVVLGKINPFRLRIREGCDGCQRCTLACRYGALTAADIQRRRPGLTCTLCGDCLASCKGRWLAFGFPGLGPERARALFVVLTVSLYTVALGVTRM